MEQPLYQGFTHMPEEQVANNPPSRPKSIAVPNGTLGLPEGVKKGSRPNYGFNKTKFDNTK